MRWQPKQKLPEKPALKSSPPRVSTKRQTDIQTDTDMRLLSQLQRAMAAEAEAAREAHAKVIAAEGQYKEIDRLTDR